MGKETAPGPQEQRFAAYIEGLAEAAGHADRHVPLKNYCTGLLLPGERKSVEPMAARLAADNVRRMHQSLHHVVADAPWSDEAVLDRCLDFVMPAMLRHDPVVAWVVDDTGFPKKGRESVGVARQYCGQVGKQDNCRVAVSLSVTTEKASMPVAYRLYLPQSWIEDRKRRKKTGVPDSIQFQTKPEIALDQIRRARERGIPQGVVLADAGYGTDTGFRAELTKLEMTYVVGIQSTTTVWKPGEEPKPAPARKGNTGRPRKLLQRDAKHQPVSVKELALSLPAEAWKKVTWRQGVKQKLQSRFAALRVRPAHRDYWRSEPHPEEWLLIEWPTGESEPTKYWLSTLPADIALRGTGAPGQTSLDHRTGLSGTETGTRAWATTKDAAGAAFIITPRYALRPMDSWWPNGIVFPPQPKSAILDYQRPSRRQTSGRVARRVRPERHNPRSITTLRMVLARHLIGGIAQCPFCGSRSG